jgi:RNA-binding protein 25
VRDYLGEEEPSLIDFVCMKLEAEAKPQTILDELKLVLEEDAEVFTTKLWRMLLFCSLRTAASAAAAATAAGSGAPV